MALSILSTAGPFAVVGMSATNDLRAVMKNRAYAVMAMAIVAGVSFAAFAQEGPRPSSYDNWRGMTNTVTPVAIPSTPPNEPSAPEGNLPGTTTYNAPTTYSADPSFAGPRPSSAH